MENKISIINKSILFLICFIIIYFKIFLINKGIVIDDEAYYLYLLKDIPNQNPTQFHKLFFNVFNGNIFSIRITYLVWEFISYVFFSLSFLKLYLNYFNKNDNKINLFISIFSFTLIGFSIFSLPVCNIPFYTMLNKTIYPISIGFLILSYLSYLKNKPKQSFLLLFICGVTLGFQSFIMITTIISYSLFLITIFILFNKKIKPSIYFILGILLSICIYFTLIENPITFYKNEILIHFDQYSSSNYNEKHGLLPIIRWCFITIKYLFFECFIPSLALIALIYLKPILNKHQKWVLHLILSVGYILFYYFYVINGEHHFASMNIFISLMIYTLIHFFIIKKNELNLLTIFLLILILPVSLSIGSDVEFKTRSTDYIGLFFPIIYFFGLKDNRKGKLIFIIILSSYLINYTSMYFRENWGYFTYSKQKYNVKKLGLQQNLLIDEIHYNNLKSFKNYLNKNDIIIISDKRLWAYSYLLELNPISYKFKLIETYTIDKINQSESTKIKMIETVYAPFSDDFLSQIEQRTKYKVNLLKDLGIHKIYVLEKNCD
jgi:hypothetical protein